MTSGNLMQITIKSGLNKTFTEQLTHENMQTYYTARGLSWDGEKFIKTLKRNENFNVFQTSIPIGTFSLSFFEELCLIRNLQIQKNMQGQGIGTTCLQYIENYASTHGYTAIGLRVFAENPARAWYLRYGFIEENCVSDVVQMRLTLSA